MDATWHNQEDPRERLRSAKVTRVRYTYVFILYMAIVSITIPFIGAH